MNLGDKHDSRHFDSGWHSGWIERDTKPWREPRARFAGAILLLWVVAFVGISAVWRYFS
jgi:hypothetical protein